MLGSMEPVFALGILGLGTQELLFILLIVALLFGAKKIPELAKGMGEGIRNFKTALKGSDEKQEKEKQA